MIEQTLANDILTIALSTGGSFAEIFIENNVRNNISMVNGDVDKSLYGIDFGLGLRVIDYNKNKIMYAYTNNVSKENLLKMSKETALAFGSGKPNVVMKFTKYDFSEENNAHMFKILPKDSNKKQIVDMMKSASNSAFKYDSLITQTSMGYMDSVQDVLIINSEGIWTSDRRVRTRVAVSAVASSDTEKQQGYFGPGALSGIEFYDTIDLDGLAVESARSAVTMLKADMCPSGKMPVVIDNGFGGVIFHEACGHGLEAAAVAKDASVFAGKLGEQIASNIVTAIDDGTITNAWGSCNIDDESIKTRKNILIENGILKSYLVDMYNGRKMNMPSTGSSRRESYKYIPVSRMTNTYIAPGKDKKENIINDTEYGIYAKYMGGGSVNPASGEFNFAVNEAYIIRNGKIAEPVRGATLIGKGSEVLMNIDKVSDNLSLAQGMCGASSGSIPVNVGQPTIRVNNIIVGGRG